LELEEEAIESNYWKPLNREPALAARDFSRAGETFIDYKGQVNEILYSILTPLGEDFSSGFSLYTRWFPMEKMKIRLYSSVAEFIFGSSNRIVYGDEGQPGLEVGRT